MRICVSAHRGVFVYTTIITISEFIIFVRGYPSVAVHECVYACVYDGA